MKKLIALVLLAALVFTGYKNRNYAIPGSFEQRARLSAGAIFVGPDRRFNCSGTEVGHIGADGIMLTARHCAANPDTNKLNENLKVSFSDNQGGPFFDAIPIAISLDDDIAILLIRNGAQLPEVKIQDNRVLRPGDPIFNVSFPEGSGKLVFHGEYLAPKFPAFPDILSMYQMWQHAMPMNLTIAPGSSGSGVFSEKQHALVGIAVGTFGEGGYNIAIPSERVLYFLNDLKDNTVEKFVAANPETEPTVVLF